MKKIKRGFDLMCPHCGNFNYNHIADSYTIDEYECKYCNNLWYVEKTSTTHNNDCMATDQKILK